MPVQAMVSTPLGFVTLTAKDERLVALQFTPQPSSVMIPDNPLLREAGRQLQAYFAGRLKAFDLPLQPKGTAFQMAVWRQLQRIPYGEAVTYGDVAAAMDKPGASRSVGQANKRNPLPIFIPCHRVIASKGMGGYAYGLGIKQFLLRLESTNK